MSKTILLVDDEKDILELLKFNLEKEGYKTISAMDGEQALSLAVSDKPDLIISRIEPGQGNRIQT